MKIIAYPHVLPLLLPSPLSSFCLGKSLGSGPKANATTAGKRKKQQNITTQKDVCQSLFLTQQEDWKKRKLSHCPLAIKHLTQATKLLS